MPIDVATHSGSFHADDVLAFALIRVFLDPAATLVRTRDLDRIREADVAIDVGGEFDPERRRFDHHQASYDGLRSSAGMVLDWLEATRGVSADIADALRAELVEHVDAVDNGRISPTFGVPCFSTLVGTYNNTAGSSEEFRTQFLAAAEMAEGVVRGICAGIEQIAAALEAVHRGMDEAVEAGLAVIELDDYYVWKPAYFEKGGVEHPTDFVLFPAEGDWRVVAIPPEPGSFDKKRPFPAEWAGLVDAELEEVVGVNGARFCHKNRFIAVFGTRDAAITALENWGLMRRP